LKEKISKNDSKLEKILKEQQTAGNEKL